MGPETAPATPPPPPYPPPQSAPSRRRLTRSSRERLWAGVAGGLAEYFDIDPTLVRFLWVAATVVSGGLAIPVYILAWIIMPRDDRPTINGQYPWREWSQEFHSETQRLADEARRVAGEARESQVCPHRRSRLRRQVRLPLSVPTLSIMPPTALATTVAVHARAASCWWAWACCCWRPTRGYSIGWSGA